MILIFYFGQISSRFMCYSGRVACGIFRKLDVTQIAQAYLPDLVDQAGLFCDENKLGGTASLQVHPTRSG
jgi:hypothetical protein